MDVLCSPKFPTCSETALIVLWKKRHFMVHHLGGLIRVTFYWLLQSKEKHQYRCTYLCIYILCIQYTHICPNVHPKLSRCCGFPCFPYIRGPDQKWVWLRPANWNKPSHNHPPSRLYSSEVNIQTSALRKEEHIPNHPKEKQLLPIPSCPSYPITKAAKAAKAAKALSTWMNFCKT